jgi:hypothetical protein
MLRIYAGISTIGAGLYAFYYAHYHRPSLDPMANKVLSTSAYNWLHVGAWALVVLGGSIVIRGLFLSTRP